MNEKFFTLPKERRDAIINAAMHIFAKYDYKKASTDEIASLAGISKGLIFHYFGSKKGLYLFLYDYAANFIMGEMRKFGDTSETDFFKIIVNSQTCKLSMLAKHPDCMTFIIKAFYEDSPEVKSEIDTTFGDIEKSTAKSFLARADLSKLKEDVSPEKLLNIILWFAEGFMRTRTPEELTDLEKLNDIYLEYVEMLRRLVYKPEYL
ncbi:MAG: TetR/AcrR family transcriptional regulator [Oscillospiraceae bacterium]|nr:TetR/AcrR family transcriptional regulator [Oscillospiraceae bacterium]